MKQISLLYQARDTANLNVNDFPGDEVPFVYRKQIQ